MNNLIFNKDYYHLSYFERLITKIVILVVFIILIILILILWSSNSKNLNYLALFILIFIGESFFKIKNGEKIITSGILKKLQQNEIIKVNEFLPYNSFRILDKSLSYSQINDLNDPSFYLTILSLKEKIISKIFKKLEIDKDEFAKKITEKMKLSRNNASLDISMSNKTRIEIELEKIALDSFLKAVELNVKNITIEALFLAAISLKESELSDIFSFYQLGVFDFKNAIFREKLETKLGKKALKRKGEISVAKKEIRVNRSWTSRPTPELDKISEDLTELAKKKEIGFLVGHFEEYQALINILARASRNNVILVGEEDIGKNTIIEHLALQILNDQVPEKLFDKRLVRIDLTRLFSNNKNSYDLQQNIKEIISEIELAGNIILYFPDIHNLETSVIEGFNIFNGFIELFEGDFCPVIGTTTLKLYRQIIETNQKFVELFEKVEAKELTFQETIELLIYESYFLENSYKITITYPALKKIVELSERYLHNKPLSRVSLDLLEEAVFEASQKKLRILNTEEIINLVFRKTKIPIGKIEIKEREILLNLEDKIHQRLIDQEQAVIAVSNALRQYRAGLAEEKGPIASFLFVGPTGVGKTELSKALAEIYFSSENNMIRFDMGQYQTIDSIVNFLGSPDGQIAGELTEKIKSKPFSLVLFDEFEKANPKILDIFLPLLDEGYVTDNLGQRIDFSNTIIICTSNAHSEFIKQQIEQNRNISDFEEELKRKLTDYFKVELLNRFSMVIAFKELTKIEISQIADLKLKKLKNQIFQTQKINLEYSKEVSSFLAELGYNPIFGARPLDGIISSQIKDFLSKEILRGNIKEGDRVKISIVNSQISFEKIDN